MNYRKIKQENSNKTKMVIGLYLFIFLLIGLLGETINYSLSIGNEVGLIDAMHLVFNGIISGEIFPTFTIIMLSISILIVFLTIKFGNKLLLSGNENIKLNDLDRELTSEERMVLNIVEELKISSRVRFMPDVYIIEENYMNAFASGWNEENSLVAITRGLLNKLSRSEVAAVLAHEMAHIKNEDVKLTLVVGILTNVMVYAVDYLYYSMFSKGSDSKSMQQAKMVILVLKIILPILTIILQMYVSRKREFMADAGAVEFTGDNDAMISALKKISGDYEENEYDLDSTENQTRKYANFFDPSSIFSTHPSVEKRIESLS